ncbi:MAG: ABC transporter ATP-binding protein, partial [Roseicyclus sp.]|nr:ABC transporter ATP-binding protein [Roseicyclus sp.]
DLLGEYPGTVLLVSHDRDFIDRVASVTVALEPGGRAVAYAGGWSDMQAQRGPRAVPEGAAAAPAAVKKAKPAVEAKPKAAPAKSGLSFTEAHRLKELPEVIARLEAEIGKLADLLSDAELFTREPAKFAKATEALAERQARLEAAEEEWLTLEDKAAAAG